MMALDNYHSVHGHFPPACITDDQGRPMHSWRVLLLPFLDEKPLYKKYNFDEPWNSPNNLALAKKRPWVFRCPAADVSKPNDKPTWETNYIAITGPGTIWEKAVDKNGKQIGQDNVFSDPPSKTILFVETVDSGINWMEPRDMTIEKALADEDGLCLPAKSNHRSSNGYFVDTICQIGGNIAMVDGSVTYFYDRIPRDDLKALLTTDGGDSTSMDGPDFYSDRADGHVIWRINWTHCIGLPLFVISFIVLVLTTKVAPKAEKGRQPEENEPQSQ